MISIKRAKRAQHRPPRAQLLGRVVTKAAYIGSDHGDLVDGRKGQHHSDGFAVVVPIAQIIPQPMPYLGAGAGKGGARDDHGPEGRFAREHGISRGGGHHSAVEVVRVVLGQAVLVDEVRVDGVVGDAALGCVPGGDLVGCVVVDGVFGVEKIAPRETELLACFLAWVEDEVVQGDPAWVGELAQGFE